MVHVPNLGKKVGILLAHTGWNQAALAARLGWSPGGLTTAIRGDSKKGVPAENVPLKPVDRLGPLAQVLVDFFKGRFDCAAARELWLGSLGKFERLFIATGAQRFLDLLESTPRSDMLTFLRGGVDGRGAVVIHGGNETEENVVAEEASVGEAFAFRVAVRGGAGRQIALFVETAVGIQILAPEEGRPLRLDARGEALLPESPATYSFEEPRGLHRFVCFVIDAPGPLSIARAAGREAPLYESELDAFAEELDERTIARSCLLDTVLVDVR